MKTYEEKLKDPRWQKKRLEILERDNWMCQECRDEDSTLIVHHIDYLPNRDPWDYPNILLITLCKECHEFDRKERPGLEKAVISALKLDFTLSDMVDIAFGFSNLKLWHGSEIVASVINCFLTNEEFQKDVSGKYSEYLNKKAKCQTRSSGKSDKIRAPNEPAS